MSFFFFFQAEDGIRDVAVTGVQTCALPISAARGHARGQPRGRHRRGEARHRRRPSRGARREPRFKAIEHGRSEEHTSELQSRLHLVCRLLLEKKKKKKKNQNTFKMYKL